MGGGSLSNVCRQQAQRTPRLAHDSDARQPLSLGAGNKKLVAGGSGGAGHAGDGATAGNALVSGNLSKLLFQHIKLLKILAYKSLLHQDQFYQRLSKQPDVGHRSAFSNCFFNSLEKSGLLWYSLFIF